MEITGVSHATEHDVEPKGSSVNFKPDFNCPDGQPITIADSLSTNQHLAMILPNGLALPKDVELLQRGRATTWPSSAATQ